MVDKEKHGEFGSSTVIESGLGLALYITEDDVGAFKDLVFRGINNSPDAPPSMKQLYDILTHGKVLQDYAQQDKPLGSNKS